MTDDTGPLPPPGDYLLEQYRLLTEEHRVLVGRNYAFAQVVVAASAALYTWLFENGPGLTATAAIEAFAVRAVWFAPSLLILMTGVTNYANTVRCLKIERFLIGLEQQIGVPGWETGDGNANKGQWTYVDKLGAAGMVLMFAVSIAIAVGGMSFVMATG